MGRYDNNLKCAELRKLLGERKYKQAYQVLQEIDVDKVRLVTDLNAFAEVYRKAGEYEKSREMLLRVYEKSPSKRVIYKLACIAILEKNFEDAEGYYQDYIREDAQSEERYVLRYRIDKAKQMGYEVRIKDLEDLKKYEYIEEWGYELAKLYHKAGMADKCVEECNDIILWFGEGVIVEKARMLRSYYLEGNHILGSYGSNLEKARERARKQEERAKSTRLDTAELSEQIIEYAEEDHYEELKKELEDELKPTSDLQASMKKDLGLSDTSNVQEEIAKMIKEQEKKESEEEEKEENEGWLFNIGKKPKKQGKEEGKEEYKEAAGEERQEGVKGEPGKPVKEEGQEGVKGESGEPVKEEGQEKPKWPAKEREQEKSKRLAKEKEQERLKKPAKEKGKEGFKKAVKEEGQEGFEKAAKEEGEWKSDQHEEGQILSLQQSLEYSLGKTISKIFEEDSSQNDGWDSEKGTGQGYGKGSGQGYENGYEEGFGQEDYGQDLKPEEGNTARIDDISRERLSLLRKADNNNRGGKPGNSSRGGKLDGSNRGGKSKMPDKREGTGSIEDMVIPKKDNSDSSVIPLDEIKAALSGMRSKVRSPGFESIELDEVSPVYAGGKETYDYEEAAPAPVEISIHYGERYQDFVNPEEYERAVQEENSKNARGAKNMGNMESTGDMKSAGGMGNLRDMENMEDSDIPSMEEFEKVKREMAEEEERESYKIAGIDLLDIFQSFMEYDSIKKQLVNIFRDIEENNITTCNFVVTGESKSGKTTMGRLLSKAMMARGAVPTKAIAKIRSDKFNQMHFEKHKAFLKDSCLIVERAGEMYVPTAKNLKEAMDDYRGHIVVILEDSQSGMERLFLENYYLNEYFKYVIKL